MLNKKFRKCCFLFLILFTLSSCIFVPLFEGVKKVGITKSDREALLPDKIKEFHELIYWNKMTDAVGYIQGNSRQEQARALKKDVKDYHVVDSKVDFISYNDDSTSAKVDIIVRRYKIPYYIVEEITQEETWEFSTVDGWLFVSKKNIPKSSND